MRDSSTIVDPRESRLTQVPILSRPDPRRDLVTRVLPVHPTDFRRLGRLGIPWKTPVPSNQDEVRWSLFTVGDPNTQDPCLTRRDYGPGMDVVSEFVHTISVYPLHV